MLQDADLLYEAKYGVRAADGKMTREQYAALRRKVGGTAKDYVSVMPLQPMLLFMFLLPMHSSLCGSACVHKLY